jgi:hypothetical protein
MLQLDPAHAPLWRSPTALQFGVDAVAVLDDPAPWQQRLLRELERGIPDAALDPIADAFGAPEGTAQVFIRRIRPALCEPAGSPPRATLQVPDRFPPERATLVLDALTTAGIEVSETTWYGAADERVDSLAPVVVLAHHVVEPRRVSALMGRDVPHVPLILTGTGAEVGPLVQPGVTACLACIAASRRDADPSWPLLAAQLLSLAPPAVGAALIMEAAFATARLLIEAERSGTPSRCHSLTLREDSMHRPNLAHHPHAECRCRSLGESATAAAPGSLETTTERGFALPA